MSQCLNHEGKTQDMLTPHPTMTAVWYLTNVPQMDTRKSDLGNFSAPGGHSALFWFSLMDLS